MLNLFSEPPDTRPRNAAALSPIARRLAEGFAYLERLDGARAQGGNPVFGSFMEQLIMRRELFELELQLAGEAMAQTSDATSKELD